jgi:hypothetical protein
MSGSPRGWVDMSSSSVRPRIQSPAGLCSLDPQCRVKFDRRCSHLILLPSRAVYQMFGRLRRRHHGP